MISHSVRNFNILEDKINKKLDKNDNSTCMALFLKTVQKTSFTNKSKIFLSPSSLLKLAQKLNNC